MVLDGTLIRTNILFKESTHLSKRVGDVVRGVVVYLYLWFHLTFHARAGWVGGIKYGLIGAARAFTS